MQNSLLIKLNEYLDDAGVHTGIRVFLSDVHSELAKLDNVRFVFIPERYETFKRYVYSTKTGFSIFINIDERSKYCRAVYVEHDGPTKFRHEDRFAMNKFMDKLKAVNEFEEVTVVLGFHAANSLRFIRNYHRGLRDYAPNVVTDMAEYDMDVRNMDSHSHSSSRSITEHVADHNSPIWDSLEDEDDADDDEITDDDLVAYKEKDDEITESLMTHIGEGTINVNGEEVEFKDGVIQEYDALAKNPKIHPKYREEVNNLVDEVSKLYDEQRLRFLIDKAIDEGDREAFLNYSQELAEYKVANNKAFE
ncbi:IDEAL domain-containing protein [Bacillus paranthracis]|uniref:IDEAL domain-containing protein n=1 Tax=Bacillus paranthracis TaxID=2026186 RepID=UPI0022E34A73|nr:IDEAL domain-containing protein [Bacillus paranthracis]